MARGERPRYTDIQAGIIGLIALMTERGGVGTVEVSFAFSNGDGGAVVATGNMDKVFWPTGTILGVVPSMTSDASLSLGSGEVGTQEH